MDIEGKGKPVLASVVTVIAVGTVLHWVVHLSPDGVFSFKPLVQAVS